MSSQSKFTYAQCNKEDTSQRFKWTRDQQLVAVTRNACLENGGSSLQELHLSRCATGRRSQRWLCDGNTLMNLFYRTHLSWLAGKDSMFVVSTGRRANFGQFWIAGGTDNICSLLPSGRCILYPRFVMLSSQFACDSS